MDGTALAIVGGLLVVSAFLAALAALGCTSRIALDEDASAGDLAPIPDGHLWDAPVHDSSVGLIRCATQGWTWRDDDMVEQLLHQV